MSEGLSPPRKRARLRAEEETAATPAAHEGAAMPDVPQDDIAPRDRLAMSSFLRLDRGQHDAHALTDLTSAGPLSAAVGALEALSRSVVSVDEPMPMPMAVAVAAEESTTDDEELQQFSVPTFDTIKTSTDGSIAVELVYDDVITFLFHMAREQKTQQLRKGMRTVRKARNADELLPRVLTAEDETGMTLLMIGVRSNDRVLCYMLLEAGADVNFKTAKRTYALLLAAQKGWEEMTLLLLEHGANDESKNMALIPAAHFGHLPVVLMLFEMNANHNYANKKGTTPLMRAAQEGRDTVVQFLIQKGADTCAANNEGMTALMLAAQRGHARIATTLMKSGSNVNKQTRQGSTALLLAAKRGHTAAVEALMTAGADIFLKDDRDKTAAETAQRRGHVNLFLKISVQNQLRLMREDLRRQRCFMLMRLSTLYVSSRARLTLALGPSKRQQYNCLMDRTLRLPKPLLQNIALFLPLSRMWDRQLRYLIYEAVPQPNRVVQRGIRIIDEVLLSVSLEQRPSLHAVKLQCGGPLHVTGQLGLLRDSSEYRGLLTTECRTPMPPRMLYQLRRMADLQGALSTYAAGSAIQFGVEVAEDVVALLKDLLSWDASRRQAELVE